MDDTIFQFKERYDQLYTDKMQFPQATHGFFANLEPIPMAVYFVNKLRNLYDVYILTAPSVMNPLCYTEKRVSIEKHFDLAFCDKLIISPNKGLLKGDYLIDDISEGKGQDKFEGELIQFGSDKWKCWLDIFNYLQDKA